jgi:hypothetical protein
MASPAVASLTNDTTIRSAIDLAAAREDEDKDNGRLALMRTVD